MYQFLKKDLRGLEAKLLDLSEELRRVNADAADWTRQSSETWHDNFGFEEGERQKRALMVRMDEMRRIKGDVQVAGRPDGNSVEVGTIVTVIDEEGTERQFAVSSYMVFCKLLDNEVSYDAPLIKPLFMQHVGDEIEIRTGRGTQLVEITMIKVAVKLFE